MSVTFNEDKIERVVTQHTASLTIDGIENIRVVQAALHGLAESEEFPSEQRSVREIAADLYDEIDSVGVKDIAGLGISYTDFDSELLANDDN